MFFKEDNMENFSVESWEMILKKEKNQNPL